MLKTKITQDEACYLEKQLRELGSLLYKFADQVAGPYADTSIPGPHVHTKETLIRNFQKQFNPKIVNIRKMLGLPPDATERPILSKPTLSDDDEKFLRACGICPNIAENV